MGIAHEMPELTNKIDRMANKAARISDLIFIPFMAAHQTDNFKDDFIEGLTDKEIKVLNQQWSNFAEVFSYGKDSGTDEFAQELANDLCLHCPFPYLVKVETAQSVYGVEIEDGETKGFSYSWSSSSWVWRFAKDMDHAVDQAIEIGQANIHKHAQRLEADKAPITV